MVSDQAKSYMFKIGEHTGKRPAEMLNHYLIVEYMQFLLRSDWFEDKEIIKELVDYANEYKFHLQK